MKYYIIASSLLLSVFFVPEVVQANELMTELQAEQNSSSKEGDSCTYVRGCGRRDKV